jgi:hypothetical protein
VLLLLQCESSSLQCTACFHAAYAVLHAVQPNGLLSDLKQQLAL